MVHLGTCSNRRWHAAMGLKILQIVGLIWSAFFWFST
ncbi:hypothetical protein [Clostridium phage Maintenon]|nr:hypothetical protein [Clostridium phage Maintenon]DAH53215.1 MAG TPA: Protein of unknown function (DUF3935) [Caudoviricetes sp.]